MLVSKNPEAIERARFWANQAKDYRSDGGFLHSELGYNYRMSEINACVVLDQLDSLDRRVTSRRNVFERYCEAFKHIPGIVPMPEAVLGVRPNY